MTDAQLLATWTTALVIAAVIVVAAAVLLLAILFLARRIERGARAALDLVTEVRQNTQVIWALQDTNRVARELLDGAESISGHAEAIALALHQADVRRGRVSG